MDFSSQGVEKGVAALEELISPIKSSKLEIVVPDEAKGRYELPQPANKFLPDWYKRTEVRPDDKKPLDKTVKACMPFMESLTFGWIVPVPADVAMTRNADGSLHLEWDDDSFELMGMHDKSQVGGDMFPHSGEVVKFNLPYQLRTPEGVSTLFMPPLNRVEERFRPFSGVVETDKYANETNIPSLVLDQDYEGVVEAGTPLVQVIPFKRDSLVTESETRGMTEEEEEMRQRANQAIGSVPAYYKNRVWEPKDGTRETGECPMGFGGDE